MADFDLDYLTSVQAALRLAQHQDDPYALPRPLQPTPTPIPALYPAPDLTLPIPHNPSQAALRRAQQQDERCGSYADQRSGPRSWLKKVAGHMPPSVRLAEESGSAVPQCRHRLGMRKGGMWAAQCRHRSVDTARSVDSAVWAPQCRHRAYMPSFRCLDRPT